MSLYVLATKRELNINTSYVYKACREAGVSEVCLYEAPFKLGIFKHTECGVVINLDFRMCRKSKRAEWIFSELISNQNYEDRTFDLEEIDGEFYLF